MRSVGRQKCAFIKHALKHKVALCPKKFIEMYEIYTARNVGFPNTPGGLGHRTMINNLVNWLCQTIWKVIINRHSAENRSQICHP